MSLRADYASLPVVLKFNDLPQSGSRIGESIIVGSLAQVAKWNGTSWVLSRIDSGLESANVAANVAFSAGSNLVGVDGTGSNAAPLAGTETRLDALDTAVGAIIDALIAAGLMAAS